MCFKNSGMSNQDKIRNNNRKGKFYIKPKLAAKNGFPAVYDHRIFYLA